MIINSKNQQSKTYASHREFVNTNGIMNYLFTVRESVEKKKIADT